MRKIRLNIDELEVESFDTAREQAGPGTVNGHAAPEGFQTYLFEGCGQTQFETCARTRLGAPCFCQVV